MATCTVESLKKQNDALLKTFFILFILAFLLSVAGGLTLSIQSSSYKPNDQSSSYNTKGGSRLRRRVLLYGGN